MKLPVSIQITLMLLVLMSGASVYFGQAKPIINTYQCNFFTWEQYQPNQMGDPASRRFFAIEYAKLKLSCADSLFNVKQFHVPPTEVVDLSNDPAIIEVAKDQLQQHNR